MKKILICFIVSFLFVLIWQSISLFLFSWLNIFLIMPLVIFFVLQYFKPLEYLCVFLLVGIMVDSLSGCMIGINSLASIILSTFFNTFKIFSGRIITSYIFFYVLISSFCYRILFLLLQLFFSDEKINFSVISLFIGPFLDALINFIFFYALIKILLFFKASENYEFSTTAALV